MSGKVKQSEIAAALGLTAGRVSQLKSKGMPVDSIENARRWYSTTSKEGVGHKGASPELSAAAGRLLNSPPPQLPSAAPVDEDPESVIWRSRQAEIAGYKLLSEAYTTALATRKPEDIAIIPGLLRTHAQAARNRLDAERAWERHRVKIGAVVPLEAATVVVARRLGPLDTQLHSLAKRVAATANPANPHVAEKAIQDGLNEIFDQITALLEKNAAPSTTTTTTEK